MAKTIYYRRRKGTLAILEEIASDITGWNAKVVEFFRRLGRTRHGLDPAIGLATIADPDVAALQQAEGLVGPLTRTGIGGLADLRNVYGASKAGSAFDEFFHTADFRLAQGQVGWYGIPRLGVFLWRLQSFAVAPTTPVESRQCPGQYTFDPTGREIPLFAVAVATATATTGPRPPNGSFPRRSRPACSSRRWASDPAYPLYSVIDPNDDSVIPNALGVFRQQGGDVRADPGERVHRRSGDAWTPRPSPRPAASTPPGLPDRSDARPARRGPLRSRGRLRVTYITASPRRSGPGRTTVGSAAPRRRRPTRSVDRSAGARP